MIKQILLITTFILTISKTNAQIELHVSPTGDDLNSGTQEQPLASLIGARNSIRSYKKNHTHPVSFLVIIADGFYPMKEPLILTHQDSGSEEFPIIYKAADKATPIFSGGKKLTGFKVKESGVWELTIPECSYYNWRFDQLYIDNERAILARTPNEGFLTILNVKEDIWVKGKGRIAEKAQQTFTFDSTNFKSFQNICSDDIGLIRFRAFHKWDMTIKYFDKIETDSMAFYASGKGMKPWNKIKKDGRIVLENYQAALDVPGEWFLDNKGTLSYIPFPGQTPKNTEVIVPLLNKMISIKGNIASNELVTNITFEGITFKHCRYNFPKSGFEPNQAAINIPASIDIEGASDITFSSCQIGHTGQHALWFKKGCSNSLVKNCYINNIGGGGIYLGDKLGLEYAEHTHHITLENNIIQTGGQEFPPAVGIWVGHSSDNNIIHNDIGNFYYTGISVGWVWGYNPSLAKRNKIMFNNIHHIGWNLLSDMAAVYTLGKSEGTVISNNIIHHVHAYSYGGWGLYPDEGSSDILMENNLIYRTKTGGFHQHYGKNNTVRNNIFGYAQMYQVQCTRVEEHRSFNFTNNIIVFDQGTVLDGPWNKIDINMDNNLYWNTKDKIYNFSGGSFEEWKKSAHDSNSLIANPNFKDASNFDFRFKNNKNARKIDFIPFDFSKAGVKVGNQWKTKELLPLTILEAFDKVVEKDKKKAE